MLTVNQDKQSDKWIVRLEGVDSSSEFDDVLIEFVDISSFLGEPTVDRSFLDTLINYSNLYEHYSVYRNLKQVVSNTGDDLSELAIFALLGVVKQNNQRIGILFGILPDNRLHVIAVWPRIFVERLRSDSLLLDSVIEKYSNDVEFWEQVDLVIGYV